MVINGDKPNIMVVDDERIITMHLEGLLNSMGYNVVGMVSNGADAIARAGELNPDLIFMDIIMPGKITGIDAANIIKEQFGIPVIFLTAFADDKIVEKAKLTEPFSYLVKPFKNQELKAAIEIALYKKEMERKLKESEEKYRSVVEGTDNGIGIIQDGRIKYANHALVHMLDDPDDLYQRDFTSFFNDKYMIKLNNIFTEYEIGESRFPDFEEFLLKKNDGTGLAVNINASRIDFEKKPAILAFFRDMSNIKNMTHLLDYLVKEINECNQLVIPKIEDVISRTANRQEKQGLNNVLSLLFKNAHTIKKAYKLLQIEHDKRELVPTDLIDVINESIMVTGQQFPDKNIRINTHIQGLVPRVMADEFVEDVFQIVFDNIIENSEGKTVDIDLYVNCMKMQNDEYVNIRIEDPCKWITQREKEMILMKNPSHLELDGMGLGLSITKYVLKRYNGDMIIGDNTEQDVHAGCALTFRFPLMKFNDLHQR